jgi:hypothetical protein
MMEITDTIMRHSVAQEPFGTFEPFVTGEDTAIAAFYDNVLAALGKLPGTKVMREMEHHGSGYASYVSTFLYPGDGSTQRDYPEFIQTTGILLYLSRLAPIAVYGASDKTHNKRDSGGLPPADKFPNGDWNSLIAKVEACLLSFQIKLLSREPLLRPAPPDITIPTVFDGPYYIFDTLFYWED